MPYRTCDLDDLVTHVRALVGGGPCTVAVSGFPAAGKTTLAGLDVDHTRANGNAFLREVEQSRRAGRPRPVATFSFEPPPPRPVPLSQQFFDVHRPDLTADVLFVPVGRMVPPVTVRFLSDYSDFVLWDDDNELLGELERLLPMPEDLRARIVSYAETGRDSEAEGLQLCRELQRALGAEWDVRCLGG